MVSEWNGKKVKDPCTSLGGKEKGISILIKENLKWKKDSFYVDITFQNKTDSLRAFYWHDFTGKYSGLVPLNFTLRIEDVNRKERTEMNHGTYMDAHVYYSNERKNEEIVLPPGGSITKTAMTGGQVCQQGIIKSSCFMIGRIPI